MKISKQQLTKVVNEEIQQMVDEGFFGKMGHKMGFETGETKRIDSLLMQVARALVANLVRSCGSQSNFLQSYKM